MAVRRLDGAALLVAGHGGQSITPLDASAVHTLGQVGEALLATGAQWQIRRLTATSGERYGADRGTLKRHVDELVQEDVRVAVFVVLGAIVEVGGAPALVTGTQPELYPEESTLPLGWLQERIAAARAEHVVVVVSAHGAGSAEGWLRALRTGRASHLIVTNAPASGRPIVDALLSGLCGEALDPRTGTVTMASLGAHLTGAAPDSTSQRSEAADTIAQPPPLAGLWDVRRSQLSARGTRPRVPRPASGSDDLTGSVLPGRFRVDQIVARGTFGTVYRARQLAVERDVALKVLHGDIDPSSEDGRLFVHEIRSVGRIDHANVVRIHQADITHDGRLFFAMELLDGQDLQNLIAATKTLPRERALVLARQLLAGLGAAHDSGLVHADVKPANAIVVERDGDERLVLVDFGLSRLRSPDRPAESAGGTPAYMAPEQMMEGRVDARSDLYSAVLVLVHMLTGWRRPNAFTLTPPFDIIEDAQLRKVIERGLASDPAKRYQTARELAAALTGAQETTGPQAKPFLPFRHLAPLTEEDRDRLHGREADLALLTEHVLFRRSVIYTAPSGVGKTSLLRAGLVPRLEALGVAGTYIRCRGNNPSAIAAAIHPDATSIAEAIAARHVAGGERLVLVLDQLESTLAEATPKSDLLTEVLGFDRWPPDAEVSIVLTIREDYLARLVARTQELEPGIPILRLPPLGPGGARDAITSPLTEARLGIEPELLEVLLADLQRAAAALGPEMGWGAHPAVYPPHLQLACSVLYEALEPGQATLTLAGYRRLGGFDAIVGEHLERVLETELADGRDVIARDLFVALVTTTQERAMRPETELVEMVGARHGAHEVRAVLEALRSRGLLVRVRDAGGEPGWELVHDSLVPRVLAWIDRRDLARRRAVELVRYHLRRSRPEAPSLLGRAELKELKPYDDAVDELEEEWKQRADHEPNAWSPRRLVDRSRQALRRLVLTISAVLVTLSLIAGVGFYRSHVERQRAAAEARLRDHDLGRFVLSLEPFDWDQQQQHAMRIPPSAVSGLSWELDFPDSADPTTPQRPYPDDDIVRSGSHDDGLARIEPVEARGGVGLLIVRRDGCPASIIALRHLPGYAQRELTPPVLHIHVPSCQASRVDMIAIPEGRFIFNGVGDPPSSDIAADPDARNEKTLWLPAFQIDRTEVTNAEFTELAAMSDLTDVSPPTYPSATSLGDLTGPRKPVSGIDWAEARAYCRFVGKELPASEQWTRALRGGERLPDGSANPSPRRNFPWGSDARPTAAKLQELHPLGPADVGTFDQDRSPDGVLDLAGNVSEWMDRPSRAETKVHVVRGGNAIETPYHELAEYIAIENMRATRQPGFGAGVRCVSRSR